MGATDFGNEYRGTAAVNDAYLEIREQALYDHGHAGYTGTIAETHGYVMDPGAKKPMTMEQLRTHLEDWWDRDPSPQKWGPAWAIQLEAEPDNPDPNRNWTGIDRAQPGWYFYGMASC